MEVTFAQQQEGFTAYLHLGALIRVEEHPVTNLDGPHMRAGGFDPRPGQAFAHRGSRRNQDSAARSTLAVLRVELHEKSIVEHPDGELLVPSFVGHDSSVTFVICVICGG